MKLASKRRAWAGKKKLWDNFHQAIIKNIEIVPRTESEEELRSRLEKQNSDFLNYYFPKLRKKLTLGDLKEMSQILEEQDITGRYKK